ncbi:MAG: universal stress protein [Rhodothalassiaceae bacterium]
MSDHPLYLVAVDGSAASERALDHAITLAQDRGATLLLSHVIPWSGYVPIGVEAAYARPLEKKEEEMRAYDEILQPAMTKCRGASVAFQEHHSWGHPSRVIKELIEERGVDMLILGRKGRSNIADMLVGSVSNALAHTASCPVLLVP